MFVYLKSNSITALKGTLVVGTALTMSSMVFAEEVQVALTVDLTGIQASAGKLYVSVQEEADYMADKGVAGGIYVVDVSGDRQFAYNVPAGEYAVSIWHDTDSDGKFSLDDNWIPTDGWGTSGASDMNKKPTFNDVKISVGSYGAALTIPMIYPKS